MHCAKGNDYAGEYCDGVGGIGGRQDADPRTADGIFHFISRTLDDKRMMR